MSGANGKVLRSFGKSIIDQVEVQTVLGGKAPLFVSGSSAMDKLRTIRSSEYLNFAHQRLVISEGSTAIFGASLDATDAHIVEAVKQRVGPTDIVAVGVHTPPTAPPEYLADEFHRIGAALRPLRPAQICFFASETFPLGSPSLRIRTA